MINDPNAPSPERLLAVLARGLCLGDTAYVRFTEVAQFSNINYVYRVEVPGRSLYLKVIPERGKRFPARLPRERVFSEAEGLRQFRRLVEDVVIIPEVLFVDDEEMAIGMSDVGENRQVLYSVLPEQFDLLSEQAAALGHALGAVHGGTRGGGILRPVQEEVMVRKIVFEGLLAPGAQHVFPDLWNEISVEMQAHRHCLIHADLWSKNLLVRAGEPVAVVDFEGVCCGDPAFDLATLIAVALLPVLERPTWMPGSLAFTSRLLQAWASACGDELWPNEVFPRTFRAIAPFLAARGFGPFPYPMSDSARRRVARLARTLATEPPTDIDTFRILVTRSTDSAADTYGLGEQAVV